MFKDTSVIVRARMPGAPRHLEARTLLATYAGLGEPLKIRGGTQTPLDSRFRGNDGVKIGNDSAQYRAHSLLSRAFEYGEGEDRKNLPKQKLYPFRKIDDVIYGYTSFDAGELRAQLESASDPVLKRVFDIDSFESKPMPEEWEEGTTVRFSLRTRPTRRIRKDDSGRTASEDAFIVEARKRGPLGPNNPMRGEETRRSVYADWCRHTLTKDGAVELLSVNVVKTRLLRSERDWTGMEYTAPDVVYSGVLKIKSSEGFAKMARRGVGRERGYGFGMLLLTPDVKIWEEGRLR